MTEKISLTEKDNKDIIDKLYLESTNQTFDTLQDFITKVTTTYSPGYGAAVHIASILASATAHACNDMYGYTGAQAGYVKWGFIRGWEDFGKKKDGYKKLVNYHNMLYPQYEDDFKSIGKTTFEWLQKEAKELLDYHEEDNFVDGGTKNTVGELRPVEQHWLSIINGKVPFGYKIFD